MTDFVGNRDTDDMSGGVRERIELVDDARRYGIDAPIWNRVA